MVCVKTGVKKKANLHSVSEKVVALASACWRNLGIAAFCHTPLLAFSFLLAVLKPQLQCSEAPLLSCIFVVNMGLQQHRDANHHITHVNDLHESSVSCGGRGRNLLRVFRHAVTMSSLFGVVC